MKAKFEIKKTSDGKYMFNLKAANDEIVLTSQTYTTREACEHGVASVKKNSGRDDRYEQKTGSNGEPYFVLHAHNELVIGRSQMYSSAEAMHKGMQSVKTNGPGAEIAMSSEGN